MKIQNNKTKIVTTIMTALVLGVILLSPTTIMPNVNAQQIHVNTNSHNLPNPVLSAEQKQEIINTAMGVSGIKAWSNQWKYVTMNFKGETNGTGVNWKEAIVILRLPSSVPAPVTCDIGWTAIVRIDLATNKVIGAQYPTSQSHQCHGLILSPLKGKNMDPPGYSTASQNDVNSSTSYYGNSVVIQTPSYSSNIFNDMNEYVAQTLNAEYPESYCTDSSCLEQAGWIVTVPGNSLEGISSDSADIVFVDESSTGNESPINTYLSWSNGGTLDLGINCSGGGSYVTISMTYGTQSYNANTDISCSTAQTTDVGNNSVFFENWNTSSYTSWPNDITGTVDATSAEEYTSSTSYSNWSTSHNFDETCASPPTITSSNVITSGNLYSGNTATWGSLSNQPYAC